MILDPECGGGGWPCVAEISWLGRNHCPGNPLQGQRVREPCLTQSVSLLSAPLGFMDISRNHHQMPAGAGCAAPRVEQKEFWWEYLHGNHCICSSEAPNLWILELCLCGVAQQCRAESGSAPLPHHEHAPVNRNKTFCFSLGASTIPSCPAVLVSLIFTSQSVWKVEVGAERSMERAKFVFSVFPKFLLNFLVEKPFVRASLAHITSNTWLAPYWAGLIETQQKDAFTFINTPISRPNKSSREWEGDPDLTFSVGFPVTGFWQKPSTGTLGGEQLM